MNALQIVTNDAQINCKPQMILWLNIGDWDITVLQCIQYYQCYLSSTSIFELFTCYLLFSITLPHQLVVRDHNGNKVTQLFCTIPAIALYGEVYLHAFYYHQTLSVTESLKSLNNLGQSEKEFKTLSYQDRCNLPNNNPVLAARPFQCKVEVLFQELILAGPLGKTKYYALRIEFQEKGNPHIHSFIQIFNATNIHDEIAYTEFIKNS